MIQNPIITGKKLPELTNPAGAENIQTGYEAIDGSGNKITGAATLKETVTITAINNLSFRGRINVEGENEIQVAKGVTKTMSAVKNNLIVVYSLDGVAINTNATLISSGTDSDSYPIFIYKVTDNTTFTFS